MPASAPISIGFGGNDVEWTAELAIRGAEVAAFPSESLSQAIEATAISVSSQALTELFSPEYLSQFSLGDLFAHLEYGSDDPADP